MINDSRVECIGISLKKIEYMGETNKIIQKEPLKSSERPHILFSIFCKVLNSLGVFKYINDIIT